MALDAKMLQKVKKAYGSTAVILLNFIFLVLILNLALGAVYWMNDAIVSGTSARSDAGELFQKDGAPIATARRTERQMEWFDFNAYGDIDPDYAADVLEDFYELTRLGFVYQPWVQFSEAPFQGKRVNVDIDEKGFPLRRTVEHRRRGADPVVRIFVLGGSTTFGDLVSDEHTWASFLSEALNERAQAEGRPYEIEVRNYGRGWYYPSQEAVLLADLLRTGHRPSLVIFVDGVNWGAEKDVPHLNPQVAEAFIAAQHGGEITRADVFGEFRWVPMVRLVWSLKTWLAARRLGDDSEDRSARSSEEWSRRVEYGVRQFQQSKRLSEAICKLYDCETLFFLQPNVLYRYNLDLYRRELPEAFEASVAPTASFYERIREDSSYIDLSALFQTWGPDRKGAIDDIHYSPDFNRYLAQQVAAYIDLNELRVFPGVIDDSAATGLGRSVVTKDGWVKSVTEDGR